jgi:hypothetical protein
MTSKACTHPKSNRSLFKGYEVVCEECGDGIGRVALHASDAVLGRAEAKELLHMLGDAGEGSGVRAKLKRVAG